jgi:hypothetical protein
MSFQPHAIQLAEIITELQKMDSVDLETVLEKLGISEENLDAIIDDIV